MADKKGRGFAGMDAAKQREIASKGGRAAHAKGTAHRFTRDEARQAGRKGGQAAHLKGTAHEFTPDEARVAGRKGGHAARGRTGGRTRPDAADQAAERPVAAVSGENGAQPGAYTGGAALANGNGAESRPIAEPQAQPTGGFPDNR